ncbi:TPA: hypothetical protein ACSCX2_001026 [Aeromonas veronii]
MMRLIFAKGQFKGDIGKKSNQFDIGKQHGQTKRATSCEVALSKRLVGWGRLNWMVNLLI